MALGGMSRQVMAYLQAIKNRALENISIFAFMLGASAFACALVASVMAFASDKSACITKQPPACWLAGFQVRTS